MENFGPGSNGIIVAGAGGCGVGAALAGEVVGCWSQCGRLLKKGLASLFGKRGISREAGRYSLHGAFVLRGQSFSARKELRTIRRHTLKRSSSGTAGKAM